MIAKNLKMHGDVYIDKECERRNWLNVKAGEGTHKFLPLLGSVDSNGNYSIHPKGRMTKKMDGLQTSLFAGTGEDELDFLRLEEVPEVVHGYALRTISQNFAGDNVFELHLFYGDKPVRKGYQDAYIKHYGTPMIIRVEEEGELAPVYIPDFDPQGVS
ncbi:MAG: hypothetical protein EON58_10130 [Alphaproteobacteria bacterium]|nr:MAG: hypothetical protein EON58_10130 [Alphaproteobacteria bacterium]